MFLFFLYVILSTSGLILFKLGSENLSMGFNHSVFAMKLPLMSIVGLLCYLVSFLLWMYIISKSDVSFIVPLGVALTNLAILFSSYFILHETFPATTIIGASLIIIGAIILNIR